MPKRPDPRTNGNFKPFAVYWCNGPIKTFPGHTNPLDPVFRGQRTKLFKTAEDGRVWAVKQAIRGRFVGLLYERTKRMRLSHGEILERFNGGRGWWENAR